MSDLTVLLLLLVCGAALLTALAAVLTPGRLFRADPPKPRSADRSEREVESGTTRT